MVFVWATVHAFTASFLVAHKSILKGWLLNKKTLRQIEHKGPWGLYRAPVIGLIKGDTGSLDSAHLVAHDSKP